VCANAEFAWHTPPETHLDAVGDATGMRSNPGLVRLETDSNLACPVTRFDTGCSAFVKASAVTGHERAAVLDPVTNWFEVLGPPARLPKG
jgi:hypothetical protein